MDDEKYFLYGRDNYPWNDTDDKDKCPDKLGLNSSKVRITNYKLIHHGLAINTKFKNRYDRKCFMCKKTLKENSEHIFVKCALAEKFYEYIKMNFMIKKKLTKFFGFIEI